MPKTAFNFFSHGTQDIYPTFLRTQRAYSIHAAVGLLARFGYEKKDVSFELATDRDAMRSP